MTTRHDLIEVDSEQLLQHVEKTYSCEATIVCVDRVTEEFADAIVWDGIVHVFEITGHPEATRCYAWSSPVESSSKRRFYAVLEIPPVQSAQDAVRAAIVAEHRSGDGEPK